MDESELVFLGSHDDGPAVAFSKEKAGQVREVREVRDRWPGSGMGLGLGLEPNEGQCSSGFHASHSPSSPDTLANLAMASSPHPGLVKSTSTELESKEAESLLGTKPLLSLVKSLSTEISRREPDIYLSKSDSKLHMPPWKQFNQPQPRLQDAGSGGDNLVTPPSPISPTELKGSSLMTEFEDTRRKFSEAIQDPMSMWGKMMGDESSTGSPKQRVSGGVGDSPASQVSCGSAGSGTSMNDDNGTGETIVRYRLRTDSKQGVCETPMRRPRKGPPKPSVTPEHQGQLGGSRYEICTNGDVIQVVEVQDAEPQGAGTRDRRQGNRPQAQSRIPGVPVASVPVRWLCLVGVLAYGFLVLPLPSYVTGLSLGLVCGFLLGLMVVLVLTPRRRSGALPPWGSRGNRWSPENSLLSADSPGGTQKSAEILEGWMNEMHAYDPETYHPSLTHSVYVTLEGSLLCLAYPCTNIPRQAAFHRQSHDAVFLRSRYYQLANCKVSLLPAALARKRIWNKKYPICIVLANGEVGREENLEEEQGEEERTDKQMLPDTQSQGLPVTLYLFGRTGREKEEWFQHFLLAARPEVKSSPIRDVSKSEVFCSGGSSSGTIDDLPPLLGLQDYTSYMSRLIGFESGSPAPSPCHSDPESPKSIKRPPNEEASAAEGCPTAGHPAWVNALVGRIFWDFLREKYWVDMVAHKIQKKLSKIRLPYFVNELKLADLDMGTCIPQLLSISKPSLDHRGLWLELEVVYTGCLQMTLETKLNLCKLGKERCIGVEADRVLPEARRVGSRTRLCVLADSDEESSSAGSSDEEEVPPTEPQGILGEKCTGLPPSVTDGGGSTGKRFLRFVDKIASSKYFQKATENEYIKKKIAEVSNMPLMLTVEVLELSGTLAVNIPPPPTDRIWYSFRVPPRLDLRVRPMLGEREVTFTHVTDWIEKKLGREFQKEFVMPNMDDLYLPLMTSVLDNPPASQHSPDRSSRRSSTDSQRVVSE
ncbi:testis-expressed protein 2 isoform X2 [Esox lucius]|uniref:testis-expressed protein 2 isoform X2 n=1 Tax=Esox lucius TaxID=8010 RepID=UPI001476EE0D|nr:testis-expressed protein 2 isoform X2 [Esox lucius]